MEPATTRVNAAPSVLGSVNTLRQALQFPGMKYCIDETFSMDRATELLEAPPGVLSADYRKKLERFVKHAYKDPVTKKWRVEAKYDFSGKKNPACKSKGIGRIYGDLTLGMLPTEIRSYIVEGCADLDIKNSHPSMLYLICKESNNEELAVHLKHYVDHRDDVLEQLKEDYGLAAYSDCKQAVVAVLNGAKPPKYCNVGRDQFFLHRLATEVNMLGKVLMADPKYAKEADAAKLLKGQVTFLHYVICSKELEMLVEMAHSLQKQGRRVNCLVYDGLLVEVDESGGEGLPQECLHQVTQDVLEATGCSIEIAVKPMVSQYSELLAESGVNIRVDDDYAAAKLANLYGRDLFRLVEGAVHIFNKETGLWESSPHVLQRAVHTHKEDLVFQQGKRSFNYGGDSANIKKMISMLPNHIDADDDFYVKNLDSNIGKLLFTDGIYDFKSDSFTPGFDPKIVFKGRIDRNFDRCKESAAKAHLLKVMWSNPYTNEQLKEGVPLCEQIALARALFGDYRLRKMYIMVCDTSSGKGLLQEALEKSCGTYVGTFDVNSFVHNPNSGMDAAKQLSWLMMIVDLRIAFSSEARHGSTLDGVLLKKACSGGDNITLRTNNKDEVRRRNRATLFIMCNDVPKIQPCDEAVENRQSGVFEKHVRFVERPNPFRPDHEKTIDGTLKDMFCSTEYQAAFLSILQDAYQAFLITQGHHTPASVSAAIKEWVVNDAGLEGLLAMAYDTQLGENGRPSTNCWVPFEDIKHALLVEGVGDQHFKLAVSERKLAMQLNALGYTIGSKKYGSDTKKVRYGLRHRG